MSKMSRIETYSRGLAWSAALTLSALAAGCGGGGGGGQDPILGGGIAGIAPTVAATVPRATPAVTGVAINSSVTATFSKDMASASIVSASTFTVACPAGTAVAGTVTYVAASRTASFAHTTNFPVSTTCTATISTAAQDSAGIALAAPYVWTFTTGLTADTTAPKIISTGASDGATGLPINRDSTATFSEPMDAATLASPATSFTVKETLSGLAVAGVVSYADSTVTFNPDADLKPNFQYTSTISAAAKDLAGNALAAGLLANPWSWTTGATADATPPTVTSTNPADADIGICINKAVSATFSEAMRALTVTTAGAFTLQPFGPPLGTALAASVSYDAVTNVATLTPGANLLANTKYTATITTAVQDVAGNAMAANKVWSFTTGTTTCATPPSLGLSAPFAIAATAGVTNTITAPVTSINGDVVLDPVSGAICNSVAIDAAGGFGLCGGVALTPTINGKVISPLYPDAGATSGAVVADLKAAFLSITPLAGPPAAGSLGGATNLPAGTTLGAPTGSALVQGDNLFVPGVYQSITSILVTGDLTLDAQGDPNAVFIFQSSSTVGTADGAASPGVHTRILLTNGANAANVFWQAGTSATLGTNSEFRGNILASADITMKTGATSCGRLFAGAFTSGAFVFDSNVVSVPGNGC